MKNISIWTKFKNLSKKKDELDTYQKQNIKIGISISLVIVILASAFALLGVSLVNETKALVIGIWSEYIDSTILTEFTKKYNTPIQVVNYDSNESLEQKLKGTIVDLFVPSDYFLTHLINNNAVEQLDFSLLDIKKDGYVGEIVKRIDGSKDNKEILNYGVPYFWGYNALTFRSQTDYQRVVDIVGEEGIKDMSFFFNEDVLSLPNFKIGVVDDRSFLIPMGLKKLGKNYLEPKNIEEAKKALDVVKPYFNRWTIVEDPTIDDQLRSNQIQAGFTYSGWVNCIFTCDDDLPTAKSVSLNTSHLWVDLMAINKFSDKKKMAYNFINFVMKKENQLKNVSTIGDFTIVSDTYNQAINNDLISSEVEILTKLKNNLIDYKLISSENFAEVKRLFDEARA